MPERLTIDPRACGFEALAPAARVLLAGGVAAGPTGTFYALMALADQPAALERVARLKGEEARRRKPSLLLIDQPARARAYAREVPEAAQRLMAAFWPGPLTLLLPAHTGLHPTLVGQGRTVALRVDSLPLTRLLARMADRGLTGTSANRSGQPPAATADEALAIFGDEIDMLIDGGPAPGGAPSTIVDAGQNPPRLARAGALPIGEIRKVVEI